MTGVTQGMNVEEVEVLGRRLQNVAQDFERWTQDLERLVLGAAWFGPDADMFKRSWWPQHRGRLKNVTEDLHGFGQSAINNASEQRRTSDDMGGGAGPATSYAPGGRPTPVDFPAAFGESLRSADETMSPYGSLMSFAGPQFEAGSNTSAMFSAATSGWTIGEYLAEGKYVDAGLSGVEAGGDIAAFALKKGGPTGYLGGVAVQTWTEVVREARHVDWSMDGLHDIKEASFDDWTGAFGDAAKQMPTKLLKIFSR